jgi:hypothetical protein
MAQLNIDELMAPIAGENAAGEPLPFAVRNELEEARKEINPDDFDAADPMRPTEARWADWPKIVQLARRRSAKPPRTFSWRPG